MKENLSEKLQDREGNFRFSLKELFGFITLNSITLTPIPFAQYESDPKNKMIYYTTVALTSLLSNSLYIINTLHKKGIESEPPNPEIRNY